MVSIFNTRYQDNVQSLKDTVEYTVRKAPFGTYREPLQGYDPTETPTNVRASRTPFGATTQNLGFGAARFVVYPNGTAHQMK